ncbi:MAG TPA: serine hydrolase domain-containing protein [Thermoanaerobaculia bacterium]|nr:serine hydrolase domain-containing protein [Thermoanaerobaculia bacterium]
MRLKLPITICLIAASLFAQEPKKQRIRIGGGPDPSLTKDWPRAEAGLPAFEAFLSEMVRRDLFSGTVLIARGNETLLQKSFGLADKEAGVANTNDTKYNLGSINKTFTHVALLQLRRDGKIDFSKTLRTYLPDYPSEIADRITIRQLLEMSSGMGDIFGPEYDATPKDRLRTLRDYLPLFVEKPLEFEPGTRRRYSNAGYIVLGLVVEQLSGMSYYDYVRARVFAPAGMSDTDSYPVDAKTPKRATGYVGAKHDRTNLDSLPGRGSSAGGGYSTVGDLLRFTRALPKLIAREDYLRIVGEPAGVGWGGGAPGINAAVEMEGDYTIIVLSNYDPPSASHVAKNARLALGLRGDE